MANNMVTTATLCEKYPHSDQKKSEYPQKKKHLVQWNFSEM